MFKYSCLHFPPTTPCQPNHPHFPPWILLLFGFVHVSFVHVPENPSPSPPPLSPPTSPLVTVSLFLISMSLVMFCFVNTFLHVGFSQSLHILGEGEFSLYILPASENRISYVIVIEFPGDLSPCYSIIVQIFHPSPTCNSMPYTICEETVGFQGQ